MILLKKITNSHIQQMIPTSHNHMKLGSFFSYQISFSAITFKKFWCKSVFLHSTNPVKSILCRNSFAYIFVSYPVLFCLFNRDYFSLKWIHLRNCSTEQIIDQLSVCSYNALFASFHLPSLSSALIRTSRSTRIRSASKISLSKYFL